MLFAAKLDTLTDRTVGINLVANTAADELLLTHLLKLIVSDVDGSVVIRSDDGKVTVWNKTKET